ncbi:hypothetical protein AMECASPLE_026721 [Ameca splendens]|uniref:Uncharacterized protein n=1 Tax=Ameca splendens TaxID=208324 RepID=A0ABV1A0G8_9TELE
MVDCFTLTTVAGVLHESDRQPSFRIIILQYTHNYAAPISHNHFHHSYPCKRTTKNHKRFVLSDHAAGTAEPKGRGLQLAAITQTICIPCGGIPIYLAELGVKILMRALRMHSVL